jgi:hypothetical protein
MIDKIISKLRYENRKLLDNLFNGYYLLSKSQITNSNNLLYTFHNSDILNTPLFKESYALQKNTYGGTLLKDCDIK